MRISDQDRPVLLSSGLVLVGANLIPLFGAIFWGWSIFEIVVIFWAENLVVGFYTLLRILPARSPDAKPWFFLGNLATSLFFTVHYGIFNFVHGAFIGSLLGQGRHPGEMGGEALWTLGALVFSHGFSYVRNYLIPGRFRETTAVKEMFKPYPRIVVIHVAILFGAVAIQSLGSPMILLVILVAGKTALDLGLHLMAHRLRLSTAPDRSGQGAPTRSPQNTSHPSSGHPS